MGDGVSCSLNPGSANIFQLTDSKWFSLCWHTVFVVNISYHDSAKTAIENTQINGCGFIPIKLYLQKQATGKFGQWEVLPYLHIKMHETYLNWNFR